MDLTPLQGSNLISMKGSRMHLIAPGGDEYVFDTTTKKFSEILTYDEEKAIKQGTLSLDDIICEED